MKRVCVLGAGGFLGKNLCKGTGWTGVTRSELDLLDQEAVEQYFKEHTYDVVVHCAVQGGSRLCSDDGTVTHNNILMFENVVRVFKGMLLYFSSGAALQGNPPITPYGLAKWVIDRRIEMMENTFSIRIWGCYGPGELQTRFSAVCKTERHVVINQDKFFDFVDVNDVKAAVVKYVNGEIKYKSIDLVYPEKKLLTEWAAFFGATSTVEQTGLGKPYCSTREYPTLSGNVCE